MRRRSRAGGKPIKARRRKAATLSRPSAPKVSGRRKPSSTNGNTKIALLERERDEALEQQKATAEVLRVISASPGDLKPVFDAILENATRICEAKFGNLLLREGDFYRNVSIHGAPVAFIEARRRDPLLRLSKVSNTTLNRMAVKKRAVQIADIRNEPSYYADPQMLQFLEQTGARTVLSVPLLKENELVGAIAIYRTEVRPFTDKQIALVQNFAAQAVIAIENTRLLNELRESLQQQTATADVLKVISSSPGELEPVFQAMLENATRICGASFGNLDLREGEVFRLAAMYNAPPAFAEQRRAASVLQVNPRGALGRVVAEKRFVQIEDMAEHPLYKEQVSQYVDLVEKAKARTLLIAPLLKEDEVVGVFAIYRQEVRPFTEKQIELVQNFAAQAVIAIENTRLLNELRESLEQQTATSEVLRVISSSPGQLEPVFDAMLQNAVRICEAHSGTLVLREAEGFRVVALHGAPAAFSKARSRQPIIRFEPGHHINRLVQTKSVVHILDLVAEPAAAPQLAKFAGARTLLSVPMLKDNEVIGAFGIYRQEVRPFTDKQIAVVESFAAQAVIAIENARLLNELRQRTDDLTESLEQQTATSEVLSVISSSPGDLELVFQTMLENAVRICEAKFGSLYRFDGENFHFAAEVGTPLEYATFQKDRGPLRPRSGTQLERVLRTKQVCHSDDYAAEAVPGYAATLGGARSIVYVPMLNDDVLIGVINIYRQEARPFTDKQIELVKNFAAQAVIAIENTRLLNELRQSLEQQTATSEVLKVISSSPGDLGPVFQAMLENATRICDAKFGTLFRFDGKNLHPAAHFGTPPELVEFQRRRGPYQPIPGSLLERVVRTRQTSHTADRSAIAAPGPTASLGGARSQIAVPMLKDDALIGAIVIYRQEVQPFTDKQIDLVQNFAAQAVIAIENTRLLSELRQVARAANGDGGCAARHQFVAGEP